MKIGIIGGGAAGMMAALAAAASKENQVIILEHKDRIGKKLLMTGNGKCNLTNRNISIDDYFSQDKNQCKKVLSRFTVEQTIAFFNDLGLCIKEKNGYVYPLSEQASTVLDLLQIGIREKGITVLTEVNVKKIQKRESFCVSTGEDILYFDKLILACGSKANPKSGSDGSGYEYARVLGHTILEPLPALVQLRCKESYFKSIAGVRIEARVQLLLEDKEDLWEVGELQITEYGISGIPIFQISRNAAIALHNHKKTAVTIDLLPMWRMQDLLTQMDKREQEFSDRTMEEFLIGILPKKVALCMLKLAQIKENEKVSLTSVKQKQSLYLLLKNWKVTVAATNSFEQAQVCSGGVAISELTEHMESKIVKGLYIVGEMTDVDGKCGGYNLQWAWSSGYAAGRHCVK